MSAYAIASAIVDEFGGLRVGECGPGTEEGTSDVHFYKHLRPEVSDVFKPWVRQIGEVLAFATAHRDHMFLAVGADSRFYVLTEPDSQLYMGPSDFGDLMRCLLCGYPCGPKIPEDPER
jgi:hypothetical protein